MAQVYKKIEIDVNKEGIITAVQNDAKSLY